MNNILGPLVMVALFLFYLIGYWQGYGDGVDRYFKLLEEIKLKNWWKFKEKMNETKRD